MPHSTPHRRPWRHRRSHGVPAVVACAFVIVGLLTTAGSAFGQPPVGVTLTTNLIQPQAPGTTIELMASASGGVGPYQYQFWIQRDGGDWSVLRDYASSPTHSWTPTLGGGYNLAVYARDSNSMLADPPAKLFFQITGGGGGGNQCTGSGPITGLTLEPGLVGPQPVGTMITFTATGSGGASPYSYQFWIQPAGGAWQMVQDWSSTATFTWLPSTPGGYNVAVFGRACESDVMIKTAVYYVITGTGGGGGGNTCTGSGVMSGVTLTANLDSPQPAGTTVLLTAAGAGGTTPYSYQFWVQPWNGSWSMLRDWSTVATFAWTPTAPGGYNLAVNGRGCSMTDAEVKAAINYSVGETGSGGGGGGGGGTGGGGSQMTGVALTTSLASPQLTGTTIQLTGAGSGGTAPYTYRFWVQPWGGAWQILRDWDASATATWTPSAGGGYNLSVEARSTGSTGSAEAGVSTGYWIATP